MKKCTCPSCSLCRACAGRRGGNAAPATQQAAPKTTVKIETNPNPAKTGDVELNFTISDQSGAYRRRYCNCHREPPNHERHGHEAVQPLNRAAANMPSKPASVTAEPGKSWWKSAKAN